MEQTTKNIAKGNGRDKRFYSNPPFFKLDMYNIIKIERLPSITSFNVYTSVLLQPLAEEELQN